MNTNEACNILEVPVGSSKDDVKKAFKKMAIKFHPDRNKNDGAEKKFKEVNEAFQFLEKYGTATSTNPFKNNYDHGDHLADELRRKMGETFFNINFGGGQNPFANHFGKQVPPLIVSVDIPFDISIIGCRKEISYERTIKCEFCNDGKISKNKTICQKCSGHGNRKYGNDDRELPCTSCNRTGYILNTVNCTVCHGVGSKKSEASMKISVPPGVESGTRLSIKNMGNHISGKNYSNVSVIISVIPDTEMQLNGKDVISVVELSLLEALKGTKKKLRTIKGDKTLSFKPKTKHRDTIRVAGFGVPPHGAHSFLINVNYPENVDDLVSVLEQNSKDISNED